MLNHHRRKHLMKILASHDHLSVHELTSMLNVSEASIRRDIAWLAAQHLVARTRGGVERLRPAAAQALADQAFARQAGQRAAHKRAIAAAAAAMCENGDTIIINGGTTTFMMAEFLADKLLRILTNSFIGARELMRTGASEVFLPGGTVHRQQNVILSPFENDVTDHHYASRMFMGIHGLSEQGLVEADALLVQSEQRLMKQAEQLVVLADSSKFERRAGLLLCALNRVHTVITDTEAPERAVQMLERHGVAVRTVAPLAPDAPLSGMH
ncbi:DeoR/GlpR family DNA-binding transcription regulator [Oxalobacteraceae bacterium A2-2]